MMGRFVLEDLTGTLPCILFADHFDRFGPLLEDEAVVIVKGFVRERGSDTEMNVDDLVPLKKATRKLLDKFELTIDEAMTRRELLDLRDFLIENHGPTPLRFRIRLPTCDALGPPSDDFTVQNTPDFVAAVEEMLGEGSLTKHYAG